VPRICKSLAGALAVTLVWGSVALAGAHYVYSCSTYGNTAPAFTPYSNAAHMNSAPECMQPAPSGGYRSLEINNVGGAVLQGYGANWTAYAPTGFSIVGAYTPVNDVLVDCTLGPDGFTADMKAKPAP
jgi:hypothetical protein